MASSSSQVDDGMTPAQRMMAQHEALKPLQPTVEEVVDEEDIAHPPPARTASPHVEPRSHTTNGASMSAKAAGKQKAVEVDEDAQDTKPAGRTRNAPPLDTSSQDAFPSLAAPKAPAASAGKWNNKPASVSANGPGSNAAPDGPTHLKMPMNSGRSVNLPGQSSNSMAIQTRLLAPQRGCQHKTIAELLKYINKKFRVTVTTTNADGKTNFNATGPTHEVVNKALREIAALWGAQQTVEVSVPTAILPQIIGRQGAKIKELQERTGARIHTNRNKEPNADGSEESKIEIHGNPLTAEAARREIQAIVGDRTSSVNLKMTDIPAELYPFIAGPHNSRLAALEEGRDVHVKVPHYQTSSGSIPEHAASFAPQREYQISIQGEREAANQVQREIQHQAEQLRALLTLQHLDIEREKHRAVLDNERSLHDFLDRTGCSIVMPAAGSDTETIAIVGPQNCIQNAVDHAMDLALSMHMTSVDVSKHHASAPGGASAHASHVARYLQERQALEELEKVHNSNIVVPEGSGPWQIYSRDGKMAMKARTDINNIVIAHPPTRFRSLDIDPFYQRHIEADHAHVVRDRYGVHLVFAKSKAEAAPILLVFEGNSPNTAPGNIDLPRSKPSGEEITKFQDSLTEAETYLMGLLDPTAHIISETVDAPSRYQDKLRRHVENQAKLSRSQWPVQFMGFGPSTAAPAAQANVPMEFRGPASEVGDYRQSLLDFIDEQVRDEAERDYTTTCDFPQKHANQLIGKKGENINRLRQEHDVEIQINDGKVEIKGPERKANKAKADILALARKAEDETTLVLKMKPQFHGSIIGSGGATPRRLQDRYKVQISFPRTTKGASDSQSVADNASDAGAHPRARRPPQAADEVIIKGPSKGASEARKELEDLYDWVVKNSHSASVSVAQSLVPSLIGSGGKELENLRLETGAKIDVPGARGDSDPSGRVEIQLRGNKEQVDKARKAIQSRAKVYDDNVRRSIEVDKKYHRALIGRSGDNILDLVTKAGGSAEERSRLVRFPPAGSQDNAIQLEGNASVVNELAAAIEAFVLNKEQQVEDTITIPPERHGALIGTGGEMRKRLESEFRVSINIPDRNVTGPARSAVRISGLPADVANAKDHISEMVKGQETETIQVPIHMHHAIFGANTSRLRDLNVRVDHAGHQRPPRPNASTSRPSGVESSSMPLITDPSANGPNVDVNEHHTWDTYGPAEANGTETQTIPWVFKSSDADNVAQARELIEAAIAAEKDASTGYLVLPDPGMYQYVIGPRGSTINGIRKDTGCEIDVPKKGGSSEVILIKGGQDAIEAAKEMIIEAVSNGLSR